MDRKGSKLDMMASIQQNALKSEHAYMQINPKFIATKNQVHFEPTQPVEMYRISQG